AVSNFGPAYSVDGQQQEAMLRTGSGPDGFLDLLPVAETGHAIEGGRLFQAIDAFVKHAYLRQKLRHRKLVLFADLFQALVYGIGGSGHYGLERAGLGGDGDTAQQSKCSAYMGYW